MTATLDRVRIEPAYLNIPMRAGSAGDKVVAVCASVGRILDDEQAFAADVLMSVNADGIPAALEGGVISSRQNIKTFLLEGITLTKLLEPDLPGDEGKPRLGIWSAQQFDTAQESFKNFDELFAGFPHLSRRVKQVHRSNGEEEIELHGRRRLKFKARSKSAGRGLTGDFVILDEAFALLPSHMGALLPTLSTRRRAHVLYGSSAGRPESGVLRSLRDRARAGGPDAPAYVEWCAPGSWENPGCRRRDCSHTVGSLGCVLDDEDAWLRANPAMGRRITVGFIRKERQAMPPEEFARERLGWWDDPVAGVQPINPAAFAMLATRRPKAVGDRVFFIDAQGVRAASIGMAYHGPDQPFTELAYSADGTDWLIKVCKRIAAKHPGATWALEKAGAASAFLQALDEIGIEPVLLSGQEMGRAHVHLQNLVADRGMGFNAEDSDKLLNALGGAVRRDRAEGLWTWNYLKSTTNISPIVAVTGALWLLETTPPPPMIF